MNFIDSRSTRSQEASPDKMLSAGPEFDLREMFRIVFRRKLAILATVLIFTGISTLISYSVTPRYTATVEIAFDPKPAQLVDFREVLAGEFRSDSLILTEIEKITSRNLTKDVVEKLNLARNPEFSRLLERKPGFLDRAKRWTSGFFSGLSSETTYESSYESSDGEGVAEFNLEEIDKNKVIDAFLRKIEVEQKGKSQVIVVGFTSESPVTAAEAVNTLAELYLLERLEGRYENVHRANEWISGRVQELQTKVEQAEIAVEEYRRKHGLQYGERGKLIEERISQRQRDLSEAGFARAEAEAKFRQVGRLVSEKGHVSASAEVLNSQLILNLRQQEAEVERRVGELSRKLKPGHPQLLNTQAELAAIKDVIDFEIVKIAESFKGELNVAVRREQELGKEVRQLEERLASSNKAEAGLRVLQQTADVNRQMLEKLLESSMDAGAQVELQSMVPDASIISLAATPIEPSYPRKKLFIGAGLLGSICLAFLLAILIEQLDSSFRSAHQLERMLKIPVLSLIPKLSRTQLIANSPAIYLSKHPISAFSDSIRSIDTSMALRLSEHTPRTILISSAEPGEGKTTLALSLAQVEARMGRKVVVIDTDYRRAGIASQLGMGRAPGLMEWLAGKVTFEDAIISHAKLGIDVMVGGGVVDFGSELISSGRMEKLIAEMSKRYDLVVLDGPPLLVLSEARFLHGIVDGTILSVRWGKTRREVVGYAVSMLGNVRGRVLGVALSMVNVRKHARYGYGDSGTYHSKYKKYYQT